MYCLQSLVNSIWKSTPCQYCCLGSRKHLQVAKRTEISWNVENAKKQNGHQFCGIMCWWCDVMQLLQFLSVTIYLCWVLYVQFSWSRVVSPVDCSLIMKNIIWPRYKCMLKLVRIPTNSRTETLMIHTEFQKHAITDGGVSGCTNYFHNYCPIEKVPRCEL